MLKQYLLFAGEHYYPKAGWKDFRGSFSNLDIAILYGNKLVDSKDIDWYQIVDTNTASIVYENKPTDDSLNSF